MSYFRPMGDNTTNALAVSGTTLLMVLAIPVVAILMDRPKRRRR